jgi:hypothetical protein
MRCCKSCRWFRTVGASSDHVRQQGTLYRGKWHPARFDLEKVMARILAGVIIAGNESSPWRRRSGDRPREVVAERQYRAVDRRDL